MTRAIARFTRTLLEPEEGIRTWAAKRGLNTKIQLAVDAHGMPVRVLVTQGPTADCTEAGCLMEGIVAECLIADRGYDSDAIIEQAVKQGMKPVIPPRKNRIKQRPYDENLYKLRHLVENTFLQLKRCGALHPIRQKQCVIPCCHPDQMHRPLAQRLVTTLSSVTEPHIHIGQLIPLVRNDSELQCLDSPPAA